MTKKELKIKTARTHYDPLNLKDKKRKSKHCLGKTERIIFYDMENNLIIWQCDCLAQSPEVNLASLKILKRAKAKMQKGRI